MIRRARPSSLQGRNPESTRALSGRVSANLAQRGTAPGHRSKIKFAKKASAQPRRTKESKPHSWCNPGESITEKLQ